MRSLVDGAAGALSSSDGDGGSFGIGTRGGTEALDAAAAIGGADADGAATAGSAANESLRFNFSGAGSPPPTSPFAEAGTATGGDGVSTGATAGSDWAADTSAGG